MTEYTSPWQPFLVFWERRMVCCKGRLVRYEYRRRNRDRDAIENSPWWMI